MALPASPWVLSDTHLDGLGQGRSASVGNGDQLGAQATASLAVTGKLGA